MLRFGVIGQSRKEDELRVPIHPDHFDLIPTGVASQLVFERGYGEPFGVADTEVEGRFGGLAVREEMLRELDGVILPKPVAEDLQELREGGILWGWPHCVQQREITRVAVERRQTLLAFEAMFMWTNGVRGMHLFYRNNEMAGYCGVLHALSLAGLDGHYGRPLKAVVLSLGSVSRGAIQALRGLGVTDITVYSQRPTRQVGDRVLGCRYGQLVRGPEERTLAINEGGGSRPLVDVFSETDIIVNGILQDTDRPLMYMSEGEDDRLKRGSVIVDVSCDLAMGFPFARPTSFKRPTFSVARATYYAVDHTPTYIWRSASWEISAVVVPYLEQVLNGPQSWERDETLRRAVEIRDGKILNPKIRSFRGRRAASGIGSGGAPSSGRG